MPAVTGRMYVPIDREDVQDILPELLSIVTPWGTWPAKENPPFRLFQSTMGVTEVSDIPFRTMAVSGVYTRWEGAIKGVFEFFLQAAMKKSNNTK